VLNVTPDHLDRYPSLEAYAKAKERIFENQQAGDTAVINENDARVRAMQTNPGVKRQPFDARNPLRIDGKDLPLRAPTLRGAHNRENAFAACLLARHFRVPLEALQKGLDTYPGLPHRLEPVRVLAGVEWINDSKATNVDSVEKSLTAFAGNVHIIMGGRGKGAPYDPLRELMRGRVKTILTIGEDAARIASELSGVAEIEACGVLANAVLRAHNRAQSGDVVLLSPACASYDQFRNFEDRGEQFKALVRALP
jgi:UDP-N-acetylmuramoylalanine--D-glutamate ligase